jgi:hypothetical protein
MTGTLRIDTGGTMVTIVDDGMPEIIGWDPPLASLSPPRASSMTIGQSARRRQGALRKKPRESAPPEQAPPPNAAWPHN